MRQRTWRSCHEWWSPASYIEADLHKEKDSLPQYPYVGWLAHVDFRESKKSRIPKHCQCLDYKCITIGCTCNRCDPATNEYKGSTWGTYYLSTCNAAISRYRGTRLWFNVPFDVSCNVCFDASCNVSFNVSFNVSSDVSFNVFFICLLMGYQMYHYPNPYLIPHPHPCMYHVM